MDGLDAWTPSRLRALTRCPWLDGRTHLAPVANPPADTRSVDVARSHGGWSRLVYTAVSGDRCAEHCRDALFTLHRTSLLAAVAACRAVTPFRRVPPAKQTHYRPLYSDFLDLGTKYKALT